MGVRATSREAYRALDLGERQLDVFVTFVEIGPATNLDVAQRLQLPINQITGRTNELVERGLVVESHRAPSLQTGRRSIYWVAVTQ